MNIDEYGEITAANAPSAPFIRTRYNYNMMEISDATGLKCEDETKAQQQFKDEVNINTIVERFGLTGELPQNLRVPLNEEFVETMDYQTALNKMIEADAAFMQLPANIRAEFQNDPAKLVDFVSKEENREAALKLGIINAPEPARGPIEVRVVPEVPPPA